MIGGGAEGVYDVVESYIVKPIVSALGYACMTTAAASVTTHDERKYWMFEKLKKLSIDIGRKL